MTNTLWSNAKTLPIDAGKECGNCGTFIRRSRNKKMDRELSRSIFHVFEIDNGCVISRSSHLMCPHLMRMQQQIGSFEQFSLMYRSIVHHVHRQVFRSVEQEHPGEAVTPNV